MSDTPSYKDLETVENINQKENYSILVSIPEFNCVCPRTGLPDFGCINIKYTPSKLIVELKSLKLYIWSYRDQGAFHEAVTNKILDDLVAKISPRFMSIEAKFNVRGGIYTNVTAEYIKEGWSPS